MRWWWRCLIKLITINLTLDWTLLFSWNARVKVNNGDGERWGKEIHRCTYICEILYERMINQQWKTLWNQFCYTHWWVKKGRSTTSWLLWRALKSYFYAWIRMDFYYIMKALNFSPSLFRFVMMVELIADFSPLHISHSSFALVIRSFSVITSLVKWNKKEKMLLKLILRPLINACAGTSKFMTSFRLTLSQIWKLSASDPNAFFLKMTKNNIKWNVNGGISNCIKI